MEVRWLRTKVGVISVSSVMLLTTLLLISDYYGGDYLGIGIRQVASLQQENRELRGRLEVMLNETKTLEANLGNLAEQGNHLRLLVDLPTIDDATRQAGFGGAVTPATISPATDKVSELLQSTSAEIERLKNEAVIQKQNYEEIAKRQDYNKEYFSALPALKPMDGYYSVNSFGMRIHPVLGIWKNHQGLDIVNNVGTPVYASGDGVVETAGQSGGGYGTMIVINHGYGYETVYAHLSKTLVSEGQKIRRGDKIALSGRTGLVTGPHLHYEVRFNGVIQNPVNYFLDNVKPQEYRSRVTAR